MSVIDTLHHYVSSLNSSKYFAGVCMIILNIGSKYVNLGLSKSVEDSIRNSVGRQLLIFSIAWMGTRDIYTSIVISACFIIMTQHLFNENSSYCILPKRVKDLYKEIDTNKDNKISKQEVERAINVLQKANNNNSS
jgi:hypothetical protein